MLSAARALLLHADAAVTLPQVDAFADLYRKGLAPKQGDVIMVVGRPGSQKSGFTLYWTRQMGLPTLYFAADMKPIEAATRLASMETGLAGKEVRTRIEAGGPGQFADSLAGNNISFVFGSPITWESIDLSLQGWVELYNSYPKVLVFDNLMDFEGAEADYALQMEVMQRLDEMAQETGATIFVLHHQSDKGSDDPSIPAPRAAIKNGMGEKPQVVLGVALGTAMYPAELRVAVLKQREGKADPSGRDYVRIVAHPETTTFFAREGSK